MKSLQKAMRAAAIFATILTLSACASWNEDAGVENHWRSPDTPEWQAGKNTNQEVMERLGPPSQIIDLGDQVVYYYMKENVQGAGYYFLVYNTSESSTKYDRAIFFFDREGLLIRHSYSRESLSYEE